MPPSSTSTLVSPADRLVTLPEGIPDLTLGWEVVRAATKYLKQPNGPRAGQRFQFADSQIRFLLWFYALDEDGQWLYHHAVRRLAKGSGKSPFAALMAISELCFPVRLKDWDPKVPGGCVGKPVEMPWVQIVATNEAQTINTMRMVRAFAPKGSRIVQEFQLDPGKTQYFKNPEGTLEIKTSSATGAEGAEATFIIGDESEHWTPSRGGPELAATLQDNLAKSGSRMLETCNAWVPGLKSVAEDSYDAWVAQEEGRTRGDGKILYDARIIPPDTNYEDPESLRKGLDFVYDDCWWVKREPIMKRIWAPQAKLDDSKRKYGNRPTAKADAWIEKEAWEVLQDLERFVDPNEEIVMFFDGSKSRDATALVGCCVSDGFVFVLNTWEPKPSHDKDDDQEVVPVGEVDTAVSKAFENYNVVAFFADVKEWESFVKVDWPEKYGDRLQVHAVPTGKDPQIIAWDMRSHGYEFGLACELTEAEILDKQFTHDGNAVLGRHVANARNRPNRFGVVSIGKESPDSPLKIDAAVCMVGARMVRRLLLANPNRKKKQRTGKVWSY